MALLTRLWKHFPKKVSVLLILSTLILSNYRAVEGPGIVQVDTIGPYLNGLFPDEAPSNGSGTFSYSIENAYPNLTFVDPLDMEELPNGKMMVIGKPGYVWMFDHDPGVSQKTLILDLSGQTILGGDSGMLGLVLHPEFGQANSPNRGYFYVWYRYAPQLGVHGRQGYMRLSRFTLEDGATTVNPASEYPLIQQFDRHDWHNGGDMFFGPDGFLYLSVGDEGGANDQFNTTQRIDQWLFGGVLRIDVDMRGNGISHPILRQPIDPASPPSGWPPSRTQGYYIPNDNPWVDNTGDVLEEFYAIGLRSPHRMTYDQPTGDIWIGDVGQGTREEISVVRKAYNLQWPYKEGLVNGPKTRPDPLIGQDIPPVFDYPRSFGNCVIGGLVCRSSQYPELLGKYLFADHERQNIWTLVRDPNGGAPTVEFLLNVPVEGEGSKDGISSFGLGKDGTIYVLDLYGTGLDGGKIHKLVRTNTGFVADPPQKLSDLGVFTDLSTLTTAPGILPYTVNAPLWSDRAEKKRWIAIPHEGAFNQPSEKIIFSSEENWRFPPGTVMIKHFELPIDENNPSLVTKLETRFVVFDKQSSAYGLTYRWNDAGTEAFLINSEEQRVINVKLANGSTISQTWDFPSRQQCMSCHNVVAGYSLGIKTRQINGLMTYPSTGITANQLETWNALGIFHEDIGHTAHHPRSADIWNTNVSREMRVRSYWDSNCAFCHRPNGVEAVFDARGKVPLYEQMMINATVISHASPENGKVIIPQQPLQSVLWSRDNSVDADQMPPIAKNVVDQDYMNLLTDWIDELPTQPPHQLQDGWYQLVFRHSQYALTVDQAKTYHQAGLIQSANQSLSAQKWFLQHMGEGKYRIMNSNSEMALAVEDMRTSAGRQITQQNWKGNSHQLWYIHEVSSGYFNITNVYNGLNIGLANGDTQPGAIVKGVLPEASVWSQQFSVLPTTGTPLSCVTYLSDLNWVGNPTNGWGPVEKDQSNGSTGSNDGQPMSINGQTFAKGIGAHANSEIIYQLGGQYQTFQCYIGVHDGTCSAGSIQFEVHTDGVLQYQSPLLTQADDAIPVILNIAGANELKLIIRDGGNGKTCDHGNWADAKLESCGFESCPNEELVAIPKCFYTLFGVNSEETSNGGHAVRAFDDNPNTIWHTEWVAQDPTHPHHIDIDLGRPYLLAGLKYLPRPAGSLNGTIGSFEIYTSMDGMGWGNPVSKGTWPANHDEKEALFTATEAQFIRLEAKNEVNGNPWTSAAEIEVLSKPCMEGKQSIGESGLVDANIFWQTITLQQTYIDPVIVFSDPSHNDDDPVSVRVKNITSNSFQVRLEEWSCQGAFHSIERVPYVVLEAGVHQLPDGTKVMAGHAEGVHQNWTSHSFPGTFTQTPILFTQCVSTNGANPVVTRTNHSAIQDASFEVRLQDIAGNHVNESVDWIALTPSAFNGAFPFEAGTTGTTVDENWYSLSYDQCYSDPVTLIKMGSFYGGDIANLRFQNPSGTGLEVFVEEEMCSDSEVAHTEEDVHYWVLSRPGLIYGNSHTIVHAKVYLMGPWDGSNMKTALNDEGLLPRFQPYQHTSMAYDGNECVTIAPLDAVDWVLVQIRHPEDHLKVIEQRACFLNKEGMLIDLDGKPGVHFGKIDYSSGYISIHHRNHLSIVTDEAHDLRR